jgi:signal transduction histidine kinase
MNIRSARESQGAANALENPPRGTVRVWYGLVVTALCAIAVIVVRLLWHAEYDSSVAGTPWPAYAAVLAVAGAVPYAVTLLMRRLLGPAVEATAGRRPAWLSPAVACAVLSIGLTALALVTYRLGSNSVLRSARHRLEAVATLKATLIGEWMESESSDIRVWTASPEFTRLVEDWQHGGPQDAAVRERLLNYLRRISQTGHYVEVGLRDPTTGALLLTTTSDADTPEIRREALAAASASLPVLEDFHRDTDGKDGASIYLGFFSAVTLAGTGIRLVVHAGINPDHELFPYIEQWPGDTGTAEVLLLRREGDAMVVVNDSRVRRLGLAARRIDIRSPRHIGAALAPGKAGFFRGDDDRDRAVLTYAEPVSGTQWLLAAKLDEDEAFAELNRIAGLTATIAAALLVLGAWRWVEARRLATLERQVQLERQDHAERLSTLSRRIVSVQEDERRRLAVELHDRTGANLAAIKMNLKSIAKRVPIRHADDDLLKDTSDLLADTVVSIREFCGDLRPAVLDYAGLADALNVCVAQFARRTGIAAQLDHSAYAGRIPPDTESVLYRITQEALLNCAKHSNAGHVRVRLARDADRVTLVIEDDGDGFVPEHVGHTGQASGSGLLNIRERVAFAGGRLGIDAAPGRGTRITVQIG